MKASGPPVFSVIVPAFNEEKLLPRCLEALRTALADQPWTHEVIVVDNNSSDRTAAIARDWGATVVFEPYNQISRARNAGARAARGEWLVFVDADTFLSGELLRAALTRLESGRCCGGGALVSMDRRIGGVNRAFIRFWSNLSVRFHLAAGCFVFCLTQTWKAVGGFSHEVYASEEVWFSIAARTWGRARGMEFVVIESPRILTSARKTERPGRVMLAILTMILFPAAVRYRCLSWFWYHRDP